MPTTILVVDDRSMNRDLVRTVLGYRGYRIVEAVDGAEGLALARAEPPNLILTDVLMPGLDGYELVRELRADERTTAIPVIFYTANYLRHEMGAIAKAFGVAEVLTKGEDPQQLLDAVESVLAANTPVERGEPDDSLVREHLRTVNAKLLEKMHQMEATEEELRRSEERFRQMAESAPVGVALADVEGNAWYINARLAAILGSPRAELLDAGWRSGLDLDVASLARPTTGAPMRARRSLSRTDGVTQWLDITVSTACDDDGHPFGTVCAIDDVTAEVEAERQRREWETRLRVTERLESLGRLAGGVAHDFNNILTAILAYTQFAQAASIRGIEQGSVDEAIGRLLLGHMSKVLVAGNRAADLTAQLLTFGRPDLAKLEPLDINAVVTEVENLLTRTLGEHIELVVERADQPWLVCADASQLSQVVLNLAVNARDAMPAGGTLTIRTSNVEVGAVATGRSQAATVPDGRYTLLEVADTGEGIPSGVLEHVFEPFFTTKAPGEGTGLGLATVHSIVRQTGGRLEIDSTVGLGTAMRVFFPAVEPDAPQSLDANAESDEDAPGGDECVLFVDDEENICDIAEQILEESGYRVTTAQSGPEALDRIRAMTGPVDLLVTDVVMPRMFGPELAERMLADHPNMRVLFVSGYADALLDDQGAIGPGVTILPKPFTGSALRRAVRSVLDEVAATP